MVSMNKISQRLKALKAAWTNLEDAPDDLAYLGLPGKNRKFIEDMIDELVQMANRLESGPEDRLLIAKHSMEAQLKNAEAYFSESLNNDPSMRMLSFATILRQIKNTLQVASAHTTNSDHPDNTALRK